MDFGDHFPTGREVPGGPGGVVPRAKFDYDLSIFRQGIGLTIPRHPEVHLERDDVSEWLPIMQHYGLPTRLLDWTTNLLVGLYFCCSRRKEEDGALFAFNPSMLIRDYALNPLMKIQILSSNTSEFYRQLIYKTEGMLDDDSLINGVAIRSIKEDSILQTRFMHIMLSQQIPLVSVEVRTTLRNTVDLNGNLIPFFNQDITRVFSNIIPIQSRHLTDRIKLQHGCFTLHGGAYFDGKEFIPPGDPDGLLFQLTKFKIPATIKPSILRELEICGIREASLFPEMEYQARDIKSRFTEEMKAAVLSEE
jgi:hypothetical protein